MKSREKYKIMDINVTQNKIIDISSDIILNSKP